MKLKNWIAPALVLALVLVLVFGFDVSGGGYQVYVPVGYVQEVQHLIDADKLHYVCEDDRIEARNLTSAEDYFFRNSYLVRDVDAWNDDGDQRAFLIDRGEEGRGKCESTLLAPNPNHHKQRLPTFQANRWQGSLYLRPGRSATTLTSDERTIEVVGAPWRLLPLDADAFEDVGFGPELPGVRSQKLAFKLRGRGTTFSTLKNIGDQAALEVIQDRPDITLNGCDVPPGWRVRLEGGDGLRLREPGRLDEHYLVETGQRVGLVSFVSEINGQLRRRTFSDRLSMAQDVAYAIDSAVVAGLGEADEAGEPSVRDDFDVHLTLDPFLDQRLNTALRSFAEQRYGRRPVRAGLTLLEPSSGRLLALATYPSSKDLDDLDLKNPGHRELLRQNHNFMQHPVGSTAKPFLAAAALSLRPQLAGLEIPCFAEGQEPPEELLGYPLGTYNLPPDCSANFQTGRVDLEGFLAASSNRYMLYMGLLALSSWDGNLPQLDRGGPTLPSSERYTLGQRTLSGRPVLPIFRNVRGNDTQMAEVGEQDFLRRYRDLFEQRTHFRRGSLVEALDLEIWHPVLSAAGLEPRDRSVIGFSAVAPEAVNLRANLVQWLRQDLYTLLLGNGNNRWSNVQMAEAMARLMSGGPVQARLVEQVVAPGAQEEDILFDLETELAQSTPEEWPLSDALRRRILNGMEQVVNASNGTAYKQLNPVIDRINEAAPPGVSYSAFGKTGTPTQTPASITRSPTRRGPQALRRYGTSEQVQSGALVLGIERRQGAEVEGLAISIYIEAQGGSEEAVALAAQVLQPLVESRWPEDWLRSGAR